MTTQMADPEQKIGEVLVEEKVISREQLRQALMVQSQTGTKLGEVIAKLAYATDDQIVRALGKQLGVCMVAWGQVRPKWDAAWASRLTEDFCRSSAALPLTVDGKVVIVAMLDPRDMVVRDNIRWMTGFEVYAMISTKADLFRAMDAFFSRPGDQVTASAAKGAEELPAEVGVHDQAGDRLDLDKIGSRSTGVNVVDYVSAVMKQAITERASDIHMEAYHERVSLRFRIDGDLYDRMPPPWELYPAIVSRIKILARLDIAEKRLPQDGAIGVRLQARDIDFRVAVCPSFYGENVVMRILDRKSVTLDIRRLGLEEKQLADFIDVASRPHGLMLLTGPTGSGKTTTLYAMLNYMRSPKLKIITAEDPVEYKLDGVNQLQVKPAIGLTFASALRSFLRQDPDVILVGEIRDLETAEICIRAAMTGHLVVSSLHTNTAIDVVPRLVDMGMEPFLLVSSLCLTAGQRLVRVLCPDCKKPFKPEEGVISALIRESLISPLPDPAAVTLYREAGCSKCAFTGFLGRVAIYEIIPVNSRMAEAIVKDATNRAHLQAEARRQGFVSIRVAGLRKVLKGETTLEEVLAVTVAE